MRACLPKFNVEYSDSLSDNLKAMGMPTAFVSGQADFRRMVDAGAQNSPYISDVLHKTVVQLDEYGTKGGKDI